MNSGCTKLFLTAEELTRVLKVAREIRTRDWCMILLTYWHGLRMSEVCSLNLSDIKGHSLSVERRQGSLKTVQPLHRDSNSLLDEVAAVQAWLKERPNDRSNVLFVSRNGGRLNKSQFFRNFQTVAKVARLPAAKRNPGILRKTLVSRLVVRKVDVSLIGKQLGHRSILSTVRCVKVRSRRSGTSSPRNVAAQETRLRILRLLIRLAPKALAAGAIARRLRLRGPNLSFHLKMLVSANLIHPFRQGTFISYSADPISVKRITDSLKIE